MHSFRLSGAYWVSIFAALHAFACSSDDTSGDDGGSSGNASSNGGVVLVDATTAGNSTGSSNSSGNASNSSGSGGFGGASGATGSSGSGAASNAASGNSSSADSDSGTSGGTVYDGGTRELTKDEAVELYDGACAGWASEGEVVPSVLELVVDVSASMGLRAPNSDQSKWEVTRAALADAIVGSGPGTGLPGSVAVGMLLYPNTPDDTPSTPGAKDINLCVNTGSMIPVAPLGGADADQRILIRDTLLGNVPLRYGTPTHDAYAYAANAGLLPSDAPGERFMVLITDGAPTVSRECQNDQPNWTDVDPWPIVDSIDAAYQLGIRTFLIGSPGSDDSSLSLMRDNRVWMSQAAWVGGTAFEGCQLEGPAFCHMDMTQASDFSAALREALGTIVGQISPCTYTFADPPPGTEIDKNAINIVIENGDQRTLVVRDDVGDCNEGWQLTDNDEILLCPTTCNEVQLDPELTVRVTFGCQSLIGPLG